MYIEIPLSGSVWVHVKSNVRYTVHFTARMANTQEIVVVYQPAGEPDSDVWVRPLSEFLGFTDMGVERFVPYDPKERP